MLAPLTALVERFGLLLLLVGSVLGAVAILTLGRKRVRFGLADYFCLVLPFMAWAAGAFAQDQKSLANPFVEITIIAALISVALAGRLALGTRLSEKVLAIVFLVGLVAAGSPRADD